MKQWTLHGKRGIDSLVYDENALVPEVGDKGVLVRCTFSNLAVLLSLTEPVHAAALNYRDLVIATGRYPFPVKEGVVPASDGAGTVEAVGKHVHRFKPGNRVATLFNQDHYGGSLDARTITLGVGGSIDGTLREYGVYDEQGLVKIPDNLDLLEGSTLSCAALTAWNALYGLESKALKQGDTVLTQGTGGVSLFALQFAKSAGAKVIATTSTAEKAEILKKLGADHVINYKEEPNWGEKVKSYTANNEGVDHIIEVSGPTTMKQSLAAVKIDGLITIIGFVGGMTNDQPSFLECLTHICTVRGVLVGSRVQFEAMNRAIEVRNIKPVIDKQVFTFDETKKAYRYMMDKKHFGKVCIKI